MEIPDVLVNQLISNPVFKTDTRAIFFLLQNPEPVSFDVIADATGVSRKCVSRSIKRLSEAGLIQPGEVQPRTQRFTVTGWEHLLPSPVTEKTDNAQPCDLEARFNRLEALLLNKVDVPSASSGQDQTGAVLLPAINEPEANPLDKVSPVNGQGVTFAGMTGAALDIMSPVLGHSVTNIGMTGAALDIVSPVNGQGVTFAGAALDIMSPVNGQGMVKVDTSNTRAQELEASLLASSFIKEASKSKSLISCAREDFRTAFGVAAPESFQDLDAVTEMVRRKKAGKLENIKNPLGYLASIAGKILPIVATPTQTPTPLPSEVDQPRLSHETMTQINEIWDAMGTEERKPFEATALLKFEKQVGRFKVPLHILARAVFNGEYCKAHQLAM